MLKMKIKLRGKKESFFVIFLVYCGIVGNGEFFL